MLADETYGEWNQVYHDAAADPVAHQPIEVHTYGVQEWVERSTIDPSLLQSSDHTPRWPGVYVLTGPSVDTYYESVPSEFECSQRET